MVFDICSFPWAIQGKHAAKRTDVDAALLASVVIGIDLASDSEFSWSRHVSLSPLALPRGSGSTLISWSGSARSCAVIE